MRGVADRFVSRWAELEPTEGLIYGLTGTPGRLSDWSPEGRGRIAEALRDGLDELDRTPLGDGVDRRAAAVMRDRLQTWLASAEARDWSLELDAGFLAPPAMDRIALTTAPLAEGRPRRRQDPQRFPQGMQSRLCLAVLQARQPR